MTMKPMEFTFEHILEYDVEGEGPLLIRGVALNAGMIPSKRLFIPQDELEGLAESLRVGGDGNGAYLLPDHKKETEKLLGRVTKANVSLDGRRVDFEGEIHDEAMAKKIEAGLVTCISAGLVVDKQLCSICGADFLSGGCNHRLGRDYEEETAYLIARGIRGRELSTVLFPADKGAGFGMELEENITELQNKKEKLLNGHTLNSNENKERGQEKRGEKSMEILNLSEEEIAKHPFVVTLMDKVAAFEEEKLGYKDEVDKLKGKLEDIAKTRKTELIEKIITRRVELKLPEKTVDDYINIDDASLKEILDAMVEIKDERAKGNVSLTNEGSDREADKTAWKKSVGWA